VELQVLALELHLRLLLLCCQGRDKQLQLQPLLQQRKLLQGVLQAIAQQCDWRLLHRAVQLPMVLPLWALPLLCQAVQLGQLIQWAGCWLLLLLPGLLPLLQQHPSVCCYVLVLLLLVLQQELLLLAELLLMVR
jgi:hypothetical protein